jgi:hypothetical protein
VIALSGPAATPRLAHRGRLEMADPDRPGSTQPYHAAADLPLPRARAFLESHARAARALARRSLEALRAVLAREGCDPRAAGLLVGVARPRPPLESILRSHALIHAAEGDHFRGALAAAAEALGLAVLAIPERELGSEATARLGLAPPAILAHLGVLGRALGPPWTQDQKQASLAAWIALAT